MPHGPLLGRLGALGGAFLEPLGGLFGALGNLLGAFFWLPKTNIFRAGPRTLYFPLNGVST